MTGTNASELLMPGGQVRRYSQLGRRLSRHDGSVVNQRLRGVASTASPARDFGLDKPVHENCVSPRGDAVSAQPEVARLAHRSKVRVVMELRPNLSQSIGFFDAQQVTDRQAVSRPAKDTPPLITIEDSRLLGWLDPRPNGGNCSLPLSGLSLWRVVAVPSAVTAVDGI